MPILRMFFCIFLTAALSPVIRPAMRENYPVELLGKPEAADVEPELDYL